MYNSFFTGFNVSGKILKGELHKFTTLCINIYINGHIKIGEIYKLTTKSVLTLYALINNDNNKNLKQLC